MQKKSSSPKGRIIIIRFSIAKDTELQSNEYGVARINQLIPLLDIFVVCIILSF